MPIWDIFIGLKCPICKQAKTERTAFCGRCYHKLPEPMQKALWKRWGKGFETAFEEAFWNLKNRPQKSTPLFDDVPGTQR